jgi:gamma-glutamyl phosphate reductase
MKLMRYVVSLAALAASTQALAAAPQAHDVTTTGDLIELCSVSVDDPLYNAAMGFCLGYIDAALDYHAALTAGPNNAAITCPPTTVSREEVVVVVVEWSKRNAQHLKSEAPAQGVMRAVSEKWPCSGQ